MKPVITFELFQLSCVISDIIFNLLKAVSICDSNMTIAWLFRVIFYHVLNRYYCCQFLKSLVNISFARYCSSGFNSLEVWFWVMAMVFNATFNKIQLYRGNWTPSTCCKSLTNFYHIMLYLFHLAWTGFELTTLVVIDTDCTSSCKSNYHTITTTTVPSGFGNC